MASLSSIDDSGVLCPFVKPQSYELRLNLNPQFLEFLGHVKIRVKLLKDTASITLNSKNLNLKSAWLETSNAQQDVLRDIRYSPTTETFTIQLVQVLAKGECVLLAFEYTGNIRDDLVGLHRCSYFHPGAEEQFLAITALEPTEARQVFPCFDEPSMKAEFIISAVIPKTYDCFSNMPVETKQQLSTQESLFVFQTTPPMSTYLVALAVGHFEQVTSYDFRLPISVICPIGMKAKATYAISIAHRGLEWFENVLQFEFALPKLDLIAVPDYAFGAQESWGLIIFRVNKLLLDLEYSTCEERQAICRTVLHEIAHAWFGNLVTMRRWSHLWLKEGMATLLALMAMDDLFRSWRVWDQFVAKDLQDAMTLDGLQSSHAVEPILESLHDVKQIYDAISYQKGCCLLNMVLNQHGQKLFLQGLRLFLRRFKYQCVGADDLWGALEETIGYPIGKHLQVWLKKPGFPVVNVVKNRNVGTDAFEHQRMVHLEQTGFQRSFQVSTPFYPLRISVLYENEVRLVDMVDRFDPVYLDGERLLKINTGHSGFFVTSYSKEHMERLIMNSQTGNIGSQDCIGLAFDLLRLTMSGAHRTSEVLELLVGLNGIESPLVCNSLIRIMTLVQSAFKFESSDIRASLRRFAARLFEQKAQAIDWYDLREGRQSGGAAGGSCTSAYEESLIRAAGFAGVECVIKQAKLLFHRRIKGDLTAIPPSLRCAVMGLAIRYGGDETLASLKEIWKTSGVMGERYAALESMGSASNRQLVGQVLEFCFSSEVRVSELFIPLRWVGASTEGALALWNRVKTSWDRLHQTLPEHVLAEVLTLTLGGLNTIEQYRDVESYFADRDVSTYSMVLSQALEGMAVRRKWSDRDAHNVSEWLEKEASK